MPRKAVAGEPRSGGGGDMGGTKRGEGPRRGRGEAGGSRAKGADEGGAKPSGAGSGGVGCAERGSGWVGQPGGCVRRLFFAWLGGEAGRVGWAYFGKAERPRRE